MKKIVAILVAVVTCLSLCAVGFAEESSPKETNIDTATQDSSASVNIYKTKDSVLAISIPKCDAEWKIEEDANEWFAVSDGRNRITAEHVSAGDRLPDVVVAGGENTEVIQMFYSTKDEVFIITGYASNEKNMPIIREAVCSFKVLQFNQVEKKTEEAPKQAAVPVREVNETLYCIQQAGVNVRPEPNTNCQIIGCLPYDTTIHVIGYVTKDGYDTGWLQIDYNGTPRYVHSSHFSRERGPQLTGNRIDLFAPEGGGLGVTVTETTDGRYIDANNNFYKKASDTEFFDSHDQKWVLPAYFEDNPVGQIFTDFTQTMINEATGETVVVRLLTQGDYINEDTGVMYTMEGGGGPHMYGNDGSVLVVPEEYGN